MRAVPYSTSGFLIFGTYPVVNGIRIYPVSTYEQRPVGSIVQGSTDGNGWVNLFTITSAPAVGTWTKYDFPNATVYRYVRLLFAAGSYGNLNELEFYQDTTNVNALAVNTFGTPGSYGGSGPDYTALFDGNIATHWDAPDANPCQAGLDFG